MQKAVSLLIVIFVVASLFCSCEAYSFGNITKLEFSDDLSEIELNEGEVSDTLHLIVSSNGDFNPEIILTHSDKFEVAAVSESKYVVSNVMAFKISAFKKGTTYIWFETVDNRIKTKGIKVTVKAKAAREEHPEDKPIEDEPEEMAEKQPVKSVDETENTVQTPTAKSVESDEKNPQKPSTVYVTPKGKKYHFSKSCAGKNAKQTDFDTAVKKYSPCKKCAGG